MAASVAPTSTRTPRIPNATATESSANETNHPKDNCSSNSNNINTQKPTLNSQELCRSCGKTSEDLYDLYHHQPSSSSNNSASTLPQSTTVDETTMPSPFTTSSTTCYAKSCTESATWMSNSTTSNSHNIAATACPSTAISSGTSATTTTTFDSVAATAKATAKGQSNMENILQEMQIWHLQIKCNDGLPQRICAKCTAQFYMIHKFRKKCLKVQSQLRSLYEEQQDKVQQHKVQQPQPQQILVEEAEKEEQQVQNNVANAIAIPVVDEETKPKPTSTLPSSSTSSSSLETLKVPTLSGDNASTTELLHINNELINDNHEQQNLQPTSAMAVTSVSLPSTTTTTTSTTNQENTIQDAKRPTSPTLLDNADETMGHATETTEESEPKSSLLFDSNINQDEVKSVKTDEPTSAKETTSTSECYKPQSCDNDKKIVEEPMVKRTRRANTERSRSLDKCDDNMLTEGQKTTQTDAGDDRQSKKFAEDADQDAVAASHVQIEKRRGRPRKTEQLTRSKSTPECCSLLTKAALKSYSTITTRANSSAYDKATTAVSSIRRQQTANSLKKDEVFEKHQVAVGKQTEPKIATAVVAVKKTHNDDNNNDHGHQNDVDDENKVSQPNISNSPAQTKEASSIFARRCSKHKSREMSKTEAKTDNNSKRRAAEQMQNQLGDAVPRLKRKCSRRSDNKRPGDGHHHRQHNELCEKSTVNRALRSSAQTPEIIKTTHRRKRERRRRPEEAFSKSSILEPEDESRRHHTPKKLPRLEYANETFGEETDENAMTNNDVVTKNDFAFATSKFSMTKANLNTLKEDLSKFSPSTLYYSAMSAKASTPAAKSLLNEDYKTLMAHDANDMKWQRRRSQRLSSSSSSSMSSSSSSSLSTTDDDDDDDDDIDCYDDDVYYETNAYQRLQKMTNSTTSIPSLYFWKTKAEMKANSDDVMPMQDIYKIVTTPKKSDDTNQILSPNHTLTAANDKRTIQDANTSSGSLTEGMRSRTIKDDDMDQDTVEDPKETKETDTTILYISDTKNSHGDEEEDDYQHRNQEVDANDGDDEEENDNEDCDRPEKADQKRIKLTSSLTNARFDNNDAADSETQCSEAETNYSSSNKEFNNQNKQEDGKQKPPISIPTNADEATTTLTPPVNESKSSGSCESADDNRVRGGMKLILQRRSSTRFACLRKEDIVEEQAVAAVESSPSSRPSSPVRKRKRKQHEEETLLESSPLNNNTKSIDEEEKESVQQVDGTLDTATLTNSQENKRYRIEDQHVNEIERKTTLQAENSQTHSDNIKLKNNNPEEDDRKYETAKCPGSDSVDHKTEKMTSATEEGTLDKLHKLTLPDTETSVLNAPFVTGKESCEQEKETGNSQKLLVRVPLASLTQHFKRMHLTKEVELQAQQELDKCEQHSACNDKENHEGQHDEEKGIENVSSETVASTLQETKEKIEFVTENAGNIGTSAPEEEKTNQNENTAPLISDDVKDEISKETIKESIENTKNDVNEDKASINHTSKSEIMDEVKNEPASADFVKTEDERNPALTSNNANMPILDENEMLKSPSSSQDPMHHIKDSKPCTNISEESQNKSLEISSLHSDILEFVQESASVGAVNEITMTPTFCGASSKITDFINDFQNNCINSPDVEADTNTADAISTLPPSSNPNLSAEIRDVEDTLNGILSEMHDRDMYTPRSGENEDFLAHSSIYSPMTEAPTTPSQSLYAESPRTVNSNPMSLSPFIQSHMDYNAMTPQSNHSSMGSHTPATMSSTSSSHPNGGVSSDHFPTYTDCFAEESTQSELIGFQNDIPCFENIDLSVNDEGLVEVSEIPNDAQETPETPCKQYSNQDLLESLDKSNDLKKDVAEFPAEKLEASLEPGTVVPLPELGDIATVEENTTADSNVQYDKTEDLSPANIQTDAISELPHTADNNTDISDEKLIHPQFVLTNTTHGPVFISTPPENATPVQQQNVQYVTMDANNHNASKVSWCNQNAPAAAATYYVNASGEIYLGNPTFNALVMPQQQTATQSSAAMETNENYVQVYQEHEQRHQQDQQQNNSNPSQQYIMVLNNLTTGAQQYITNPTTAPTVLLHTQLANNNCSYVNSQSTTGEIEQNSNGTIDQQVPATTMPTFSIATSIPGQHATVSIDTRSVESQPTPARQREINRHNVHKLLQQKIQQQKPIKPRPVAGQRTQQKINLICRFCHKRPKFTNNVDYSNHIITMHPAEKPYNCDYCPKHFQRRSERQDHVAQVHGSRYQCAQCGVSFCAQRALDFHLQKFHASSTLCTIPPRIATVAPTQQLQSSSASSTLALNHLQQNSTSSTSSSSSSTSSSSSSLSAASSPLSYNLLHTAQQQRLVHHHHRGAAEDVHAHNEDEEEETKHNNNNNKCSFDSQLEIMNETTMKQHRYQQPTRKLCCPDCDGDDAASCCSMKSNPPNNHKQLFNQQQFAVGNLSVCGGNQQVQINIPSPEQTEPDSTTTLRHFRKNVMKCPSVAPTICPGNSSCMTYACTYGNNNKKPMPATRELYNCHLCSDAFPTAHALRKHRNIIHNNQCTMPFICTICKRGFRLRNALQRHMETHDAEGRPYECNICQVRFPRPSQLTLHKLTVHKFEKIHTCNECGKQFGTESSLKAHEKVSHEANSMPLPFACVYLEAPKNQKPKISKD